MTAHVHSQSLMKLLKPCWKTWIKSQHTENCTILDTTKLTLLHLYDIYELDEEIPLEVSFDTCVYYLPYIQHDTLQVQPHGANLRMVIHC